MLNCPKFKCYKLKCPKLKCKTLKSSNILRVNISEPFLLYLEAFLHPPKLIDPIKYSLEKIVQCRPRSFTSRVVYDLGNYESIAKATKWKQLNSILDLEGLKVSFLQYSCMWIFYMFAWPLIGRIGMSGNMSHFNSTANHDG